MIIKNEHVMTKAILRNLGNPSTDVRHYALRRYQRKNREKRFIIY
jgi:hypothetical protein